MWRDVAYLLDMLIYARKASIFCKDSSLEKFMTDEVLQSATLHVLQIIGEAANKVSQEFQEVHPEVPWQRIINFRHRLVHDYPRIEIPKVWSIVQEQIPPLISELEKLVPPESPENDS